VADLLQYGKTTPGIPQSGGDSWRELMNVWKVLDTMGKNTSK